MTIYTVGYGNRAIHDFIDLLRHYGIGVLVDTRSIPYSRFRPDFRKKALQEHLEGSGIEYVYLGEALGGKKVPEECLVDGKVELALLEENGVYQQGLAQVIGLVSQNKTVAIMCAEQKPENCHRARMLSPSLIRRGMSVIHIDEKGALKTQEEVMGWFG